jgi:hypothetical protein
MNAVVAVLGPCDAVYDASTGLRSVNIYRTHREHTKAFNSALKSPDVPYSEKGKPRHPQKSHCTLADAVRFGQFPTICGTVRAPYT